MKRMHALRAATSTLVNPSASHWRARAVGLRPLSRERVVEKLQAGRSRGHATAVEATAQATRTTSAHHPCCGTFAEFHEGIPTTRVVTTTARDGSP